MNQCTIQETQGSSQNCSKPFITLKRSEPIQMKSPDNMEEHPATTDLSFLDILGDLSCGPLSMTSPTKFTYCFNNWSKPDSLICIKLETTYSQLTSSYVEHGTDGESYIKMSFCQFFHDSFRNFFTFLLHFMLLVCKWIQSLKL